MHKLAPWTASNELHATFPYTIPNARQRTATMPEQRTPNITRLLLAAVVITFGAYWAGARWGQRQPVGVGAVPRTSGAANGLAATNLPARDAALTDEEAINLPVYPPSSPPSPTILPTPPKSTFFL